MITSSPGVPWNTRTPLAESQVYLMIVGCLPKHVSLAVAGGSAAAPTGADGMKPTLSANTLQTTAILTFTGRDTFRGGDATRSAPEGEVVTESRRGLPNHRTV